MPASDVKKLSGIFISYRRSDNPDATGRIYDRLVSEFGKARVFKDVDSIPLGQDFRGHLNDIVSGCAVVLAVIGPRWTDARNSAGQRRLEDTDDFVRIELEAALARDIPVVPVLVGHAPMPGTGELPASLASMAFRQSIEVRPDPDFHNDATRLVSALRVMLDPDGPPAQAQSGRQATHGRPLTWMIAFAMAALVAAVLTIPALKHLREAPAVETRTEIRVPTRSGAAGTMALSPDGRQIVFTENLAGVSRLWLRPLAATTAQVLPGTEGASNAFWSPDSRSIGFFTINALKRIDLGAGAPLTLAPATDGMGGTWNAQGVILFSQGVGKPLAHIAATGGTATEITEVEQEAVARFSPVFLPGGRRYVYGSGGGKSPGIYLGSLDGTAPIRLTPVIGAIAYLPSGWLLIWEGTQGVLFAQRLDADKAALVGAPVTLAQGVSGAVSGSNTGLIAYWGGVSEASNRQLQWRSRTGADLGSIGELNETYDAPRVSPDGRRVVVARGEVNKQDLWLLEGERASRITFDASGSTSPVWSPDGSQIVFGSSRADAPGIYQKPIDGAGAEQLYLSMIGVNGPASWSSDSRYLSYVYIGKGTTLDVGILPMSGDRKPWAFINSASFEGAAEFSPDGKWVAYESDETKRLEVYIRPFVAPGAAGGTPAYSGKWQVSTSGGIHPKWSASGKELFFLNPEADMMAAPITFSGSALTSGTPVKLFQTHVQGGGRSNGGPQYDVARDGRFLINTVLDAPATEAAPIILIQNWNPGAGK